MWWPFKPQQPQLKPYDDPAWPMLPRFVVEKAVDGGWPFDGNLGPHQLLDIRLFRALARDNEGFAIEFAHKAFDFYLHSIGEQRGSGVATMGAYGAPTEELQQRAVKFWHILLD